MFLIAAVFAPLLSMAIFSGHAALIDGALQKALRGVAVSLGAKREVNRVALTVHSPVQVLPLAGNFDIGFVQPPTHAHRAFAPAKRCGEHGQDFDGPAVHAGAIDRHAALAVISSM